MLKIYQHSIHTMNCHQMHILNRSFVETHIILHVFTQSISVTVNQYIHGGVRIFLVNKTIHNNTFFAAN